MIGSRAANGSSRRRIEGSAASARATPTRWRCPPESWRGGRVAELWRAEAPCRESSSSTRASVRAPLPALEGRDERDVFGDREVREEPGVLEDVADAPPQPDGVPVARALPLDEDLARGREDERVDHLERRRLALAAPAQEDERFAREDVEVEAPEDLLAAEGARDIAEGDHGIHRGIVSGRLRGALHAIAWHL